MGQPRKPYELKKMQGTLNVTRDKAPDFKGTIVLEMEAPKDLNEWGQAYWVQIFEEVKQFGLITQVDLGAFAAGCKWYGIMCESLDIVDAKGLEIDKHYYDKEGNICGTEQIENPMIRTAERATKLYLSFCQRFGLTPADRTRISVMPKDNEPDPFKDV